MKIIFSFKNISNSTVLTDLVLSTYDVSGVRKVYIDNEASNMEIVVDETLIDQTINLISDLTKKFDSKALVEYTYKE
jgi:hypothetical protein